jgi:hypothetical protein
MHTTMIRTRVLTIAATAAIAVGACGAPATPDLTSPTEIVLATLATTETAKSVHLEATVSGELKMSVLPGAPATPIDLTGTTVSGDVALDAGAVHATFKVPNLFDLAGELIVVDGKGYFKTTVTGAQYQVTSLGEAIPKTGKGLADTLGDLLMSEDVTLTKGGDVGCGGKQCYTVTTQLTAEDLGGVQVTGLPIDIAGATVDIEIRVEKELPNHLGGLTVTMTLPDTDPVVVDVAFSKWDEAVTVTAPPADQVAGG